MNKPSIAIVIGTIRQGRFADRPAQWMLELAQEHAQANYELVDLRNYPLPFFDEVKSPMYEMPENPAAQQWLNKLKAFDGYIFLTAEYNFSISGALKNALDYVYREFYRKPAAVVGYGEIGGGRAVQQLRLICIDLHLAPLRNAVHIGGQEFVALSCDDGKFEDFPHLKDAAMLMLDDLVWWSNTLKLGNNATIATTS